MAEPADPFAPSVLGWAPASDPLIGVEIIDHDLPCGAAVVGQMRMFFDEADGR